MKHLILTLTAFTAFAFEVHSQETLSLADCYSLARDHYPTLQKLDLIEKTKEYTLANANKAYLPQLSISAQATYQSETVDLAGTIGNALPLPPNITLPVIDKEQYKVMGEVSQLLYNGGATRSYKQIAEANSAAQLQAVETQLYALKQRISDLYFSVLLIDRQLAQNRLNAETLQSQLRKAETALKNGTTLPSNVAELKAEILRIEMQTTEYEATQAMYLKMLSTFVGKKITNAAALEQPADKSAMNTTNQRPELRHYDLQTAVLNLQEKQLTTEYLPKVSAFFQGAYGRPTLNILNNTPDFYYITGVRLQWNLSPLYSLSNKKKLLLLNKESLVADRNAFLLNTQLDLTRQSEQIQKLQKLIEQDKESADLRHAVAQAAEVQLDNGVITTHEYLQKVNAQHLAQQALLLHQIQLLQAKENHQIILGQ